MELYEDAADDGDDPQIREFAAKRLPTLEQHMRAGEELEELVENTRRSN